jgi:superoxide dismutase, Fe-Mn family
MDLHYNRHHLTYVTQLNAALHAQSEAIRTNDLLALLSLQPLIKFHAGGHINHTLFWASLCAPSSTSDPSHRAPTLHAALAKSFASTSPSSSFKTLFTATALALQGSGWVWLLRDAGNKDRLEIATSKDQDLPVGVAEGKKGIVLGLDMWEHAYYLQYWNDKKSYVEKWWEVVNWEVAEERFGVGDVREVLEGVGLGGLVGKL